MLAHSPFPNVYQVLAHSLTITIAVFISIIIILIHIHLFYVIISEYRHV